jgi:hypothetical protein
MKTHEGLEAEFQVYLTLVLYCIPVASIFVGAKGIRETFFVSLQFLNLGQSIGLLG